MNKLIFVLSIAILAVLVAPSRADEGVTKLRVCARPNPGFLEAGPDGPVGLEFDLLSSFAETQNVELEFIWLDSFKELLPKIEAGACDLGAAGVTVTAERSRRVAFSAPYFPTRPLFIEKKSAFTAGPEKLGDGQRIAVVHGTLHEELISRREGVKVIPVDDDRSLFLALEAGHADGAVCDSAIVLPFLSEFTELTVRFPLADRAFFAFPLPLGSPWKGKLDQFLSNLERNDGYRSSLVEHFGAVGASFILEEDQLVEED